jgi:hypothetical protein
MRLEEELEECGVDQKLFFCVWQGFELLVEMLLGIQGYLFSYPFFSYK